MASKKNLELNIDLNLTGEQQLAILNNQIAQITSRIDTLQAKLSRAQNTNERLLDPSTGRFASASRRGAVVSQISANIMDLQAERNQSLASMRNFSGQFSAGVNAQGRNIYDVGQMSRHQLRAAQSLISQIGTGNAVNDKRAIRAMLPNADTETLAGLDFILRNQKQISRKYDEYDRIVRERLNRIRRLQSANAEEQRLLNTINTSQSHAPVTPFQRNLNERLGVRDHTNITDKQYDKRSASYEKLFVGGERQRDIEERRAMGREARRAEKAAQVAEAARQREEERIAFLKDKQQANLTGINNILARYQRPRGLAGFFHKPNVSAEDVYRAGEYLREVRFAGARLGNGEEETTFDAVKRMSQIGIGPMARGRNGQGSAFTHSPIGRGLHSLANIAGRAGLPLYAASAAGVGYAAYSGLRSAFQNSGEVESQKLFLQGLYNTFNTFKVGGQSVNPVSNFVLSAGQSDRLYQKVRKTAVASPLTTQELFKAYSIGYPFIAKKGVTADQAVDIVDNVASIGKLLGLREESFQDDLRALSTGNYRNVQSFQAVGVTRSQFNKISRMSGDPFVKEITTAFAPFNQAIKQYDQTYQGKMARFEDSMFRLSATFGEKMADPAKKSIDKIVSAVDKLSQSGSLDKLAELINKFIDAITAIAMKFGDIAPALSGLLEPALWGLAGTKLIGGAGRAAVATGVAGRLATLGGSAITAQPLASAAAQAGFIGPLQSGLSPIASGLGGLGLGATSLGAASYALPVLATMYAGYDMLKYYQSDGLDRGLLTTYGDHLFFGGNSEYSKTAKANSTAMQAIKPGLLKNNINKVLATQTYQGLKDKKELYNALDLTALSRDFNHASRTSSAQEAIEAELSKTAPLAGILSRSKFMDKMPTLLAQKLGIPTKYAGLLRNSETQKFDFDSQRIREGMYQLDMNGDRSVLGNDYFEKIIQPVLDAISSPEAKAKAEEAANELTSTLFEEISSSIKKNATIITDISTSYIKPLSANTSGYYMPSAKAGVGAANADFSISGAQERFSAALAINDFGAAGKALNDMKKAGSDKFAYLYAQNSYNNKISQAAIVGSQGTPVTKLKNDDGSEQLFFGKTTAEVLKSKGYDVNLLTKVAIAAQTSGSKVDDKLMMNMVAAGLATEKDLGITKIAGPDTEESLRAWKAQVKSLASKMGLKVGSEFRPGATTAGSGHTIPSNHSKSIGDEQGMALDIFGTESQMANFFDSARTLFGDDAIKELIYTPRGIVSRGKYSTTIRNKKTAKDHYNHVHISLMGQGGIRLSMKKQEQYEKLEAKYEKKLTDVYGLDAKGIQAVIFGMMKNPNIETQFNAGLLGNDAKTLMAQTDILGFSEVINNMGLVNVKADPIGMLQGQRDDQEFAISLANQRAQQAANEYSSIDQIKQQEKIFGKDYKSKVAGLYGSQVVRGFQLRSMSSARTLRGMSDDYTPFLASARNRLEASGAKDSYIASRYQAYQESIRLENPGMSLEKVRKIAMSRIMNEPEYADILNQENVSKLKAGQQAAIFGDQVAAYKTGIGFSIRGMAFEGVDDFGFTPKQKIEQLGLQTQIELDKLSYEDSRLYQGKYSSSALRAKGFFVGNTMEEQNYLSGFGERDAKRNALKRGLATAQNNIARTEAYAGITRNYNLFKGGLDDPLIGAQLAGYSQTISDAEAVLGGTSLSNAPSLAGMGIGYDDKGILTPQSINILQDLISSLTQLSNTIKDKNSLEQAQAEATTARLASFYTSGSVPTAMDMDSQSLQFALQGRLVGVNDERDKTRIKRAFYAENKARYASMRYQTNFDNAGEVGIRAMMNRQDGISAFAGALENTSFNDSMAILRSNKAGLGFQTYPFVGEASTQFPGRTYKGLRSDAMINVGSQVGGSMIVNAMTSDNSYAQEGMQLGSAFGPAVFAGLGPWGAGVGLLAGGLLGGLFKKKNTQEDQQRKQWQDRVAQLLSNIDRSLRPAPDYFRSYKKEQIMGSATKYLSGRNNSTSIQISLGR